MEDKAKNSSFFECYFFATYAQSYGFLI